MADFDTDRLSFLGGGGVSGQQCRALDWAATPLGAPHDWPQSLRTAVQLMLNTQHPVMIYWGVEATFMFNDAAARSCGAERRATAMGRPGRTVWHEIWHIIGPQIDQVMGGGPATWHVNQLVPMLRDGRMEDMYWTYSHCPIGDSHAANGVGGVLVLATDTTTTVLAERHRAAEAQRQTRMFEQAPGFVSIMRGPDHVVEFVNREHDRLFNSRPWVGHSIRTAFPEIEAQGFYKRLDEVYATGNTYKAMGAAIHYHHAEMKERTTAYLDFVYAPLFDDDGQVYGIFSGGYDVTERLNTERELREVEEQLRLATDAAEIGWWDVVEGYDRLLWPPRVKAMFGISAGAPVSMDDFFNGLHEEDREHVSAAYAAAADPARRALYDVEYRTVGKEDGVLRWVAAKGRGMFDHAGRCVRVLGTAIDITQRRQAQELILQRQREDNDLREQFIAVLGHDLRNPLASVAAGMQLILRRPARATELAEPIQRSLQRMEELIENILDFARGRLGGGFVTNFDNREPLAPVLHHVVEELQAVHPARIFDVDIALSAPVACNRQRIAQLLSNLLGNACAYGDLAAPVSVRARTQDGAFTLSVANAGTAIEPAILDRLFQPFFRGEAKEKKSGLGLGLYICSEIAKAHDGTLTATSTPAQTRFTLSMPVSGPAQAT